MLFRSAKLEREMTYPDRFFKAQELKKSGQQEREREREIERQRRTKRETDG